MIYYLDCQDCDIQWTYTPEEYEKSKFDKYHLNCQFCGYEFHRWIKREGIYKTSTGRIVNIDPKNNNSEYLAIEKRKPKKKKKKRLAQPKCHICKKKFKRSKIQPDQHIKKIKQHQQNEHGLQFGEICREESRRQFRNRHETYYTLSTNIDRLLQDQLQRYLFNDDNIGKKYERNSELLVYPDQPTAKEGQRSKTW